MPKRFHVIYASLLGFLIVILPIWWKQPDASAPFTSTYSMGFVASWLIIVLTLVTIGWAIRQAIHITRWQILWAILWGVFVLWVWASQSWAFVGDTQAGVAQNATLQLMLIALFAIAMSLSPAQPSVPVAFFIMLAIHGTIGALQVAQQNALGLPAEFSMNPAVSGTSVIQAGDLRWLRPYGLLPHPNIWAGFIGAGTLVAVYAYCRGYRLALSAVITGWYLLLLSFSRGAWFGFAISILLVMPTLWRFVGWRRIALLATASLITGAVFTLLYAPLLLTRTGMGQENTEMRSIADRIVFTDIAFDAIETYPLLGVGAGNYPWYAADYLMRRTDFDLKGDNVHTVSLGIWAELGIVGITLWVLLVSSALGRGLWLIWHEPVSWRIVWWAIAMMWFVIGIFDHYPWTLITTQAFWVMMLAWCIRPLQALPQGDAG